VYFLALAADYDGTIAHDGVVDEATIAALKRFKATGRKLVLVTGRELPDLKRVFREVNIFDRVVAENGAVIYDPQTEEERTLASPPPPKFVETLRQRKVAPLSVGNSIVATWMPHETTVLETIRDLGLELEIIFNKGAVMVLPTGINKAAGLKAALKQLELSPHNVVAVGDAENDHTFLQACGCAAAVANALPTVKERADVQLQSERGAGVAELLEMICRDDTGMIPPERHGLSVGRYADGREALLEPHRGSVLITGRSGIGKSTLATALTERMVEKQFEFCVFDPEGDYDGLQNAVSIGDADTPPKAEDALEILLKADVNVAINTQALDVAERPIFFAKLLPQVSSLRARTGRPHWLIIDEAHHLMPASQRNLPQILPKDFPAAILISVHPEAVSPDVLKSVGVVLALGPATADVLVEFADTIGIEVAIDAHPPAEDEILIWDRYSGEGPRVVKPIAPRQAHRRHTRKYAEGDLGEDLSFYFRGPDNSLNLRAQNLMLFKQIADGVDDRTWEHHLRSGEYSRWFRDVIKDKELARAAESVEADDTLDAKASRRLIANAIDRLYTAPARAG
jgi:hydroxymethylpyrimidine pyrophosphatase-like HAD family hydrolase